MYFPFMVDLQGKKLVIVGGGEVAFRKCLLFLSFGAEIDVVSPSLWGDFASLEGRFRNIESPYEPAFLTGAFAAIAATDDRELNERIYRDCCHRNIPVNVVDMPELCSFFVPAVLQRGDLTIGVSTGGKSPALAGRIRRELAETYGEEYGERLELLGQLRALVKERISDIRRRRELLTAASGMENEEIREQMDMINRGVGADR